jgi:hypothetical protein
VRTGEATIAQFTIAHKRFHAEVSQRVLSVARILVRHFREAERLVLTYGMGQRLRTLDALQIAVALDLWRNLRIDHFVVADVVVVDVATREGLPTVNVLGPAAS